MRRHHRLLALTVAAALTVTAAACSSDDEPRAATTAAPATDPAPAPAGTLGTLPTTDGSAPPSTAADPFASVSTEYFPDAPAPQAVTDIALPGPPFTTVTPKATGEVAVVAEPGGTPAWTFPNPRPIGDDPAATVPLTFLVKNRLPGGWLEVYLPVRPNGSVGYVQAADYEAAQHSYHIEVRLSEFNLKVYNGDGLILDAPIGVASGNTPTPGGLYYTTELIASTNPAYGNHAYGLSGYSEVLKTFNGGPGQLGIHGTNQPASIGTAVSHGCIRMRNEDIDRLVPVLPLGVPVAVYT